MIRSDSLLSKIPYFREQFSFHLLLKKTEAMRYILKDTPSETQTGAMSIW